jgi:hypothetical protein
MRVIIYEGDLYSGGRIAHVSSSTERALAWLATQGDLTGRRFTFLWRSV